MIVEDPWVMAFPGARVAGAAEEGARFGLFAAGVAVGPAPTRRCAVPGGEPVTT